MVKTGIVLLTLLVSFSALAQLQNSTSPIEEKKIFNPMVDNIADKLPPLEMLIDSAIKNAPYIRMAQTDIRIADYRIREAKLYWTRNLGIFGQINTGTFYNFSTNESQGSYVSEFYTERQESRTNIGVYVRFPFFDMINHKNQINQAKREKERDIIRKEQMERDTKKEVIMVFQDLLMRQELLKIKNESQLTTRLQVSMAEEEFRNGSMTVAEMARLTEMHARNIYDYMKEKALFFQQYLILEELVGMKFNLLNIID